MNIRRFLILTLKDPGTFYAIGNACLFAVVNALSFIAILLTLGFCIFCRWAASNSHNEGKFALFQHMGQNPYLGLELMGYTCLLVALMALINQTLIGFICSACFGYANVILAHNLRLENAQTSVPFQEILHKIRSNESLTPLILALTKEPIVLISLGLLYSGLSAGTSSLLVLPLICLAPYLSIVKSNMNRAIPQTCFAVCTLWYALVGLSNHLLIPAFANACFTIAFIKVALTENQIYRQSHV